MNKLVFKPFWSYDVISTEKWLSKMAAIGFELKSVHFKSRIFVFQEEQPKLSTYRIVYDKSQTGLTKTLQNCGWFIVDERKRWVFIQNNNDEIALYPQRDSIIAKNRRLSLVALILLVIMGCNALMSLGIMVLLILMSNASVKYVPAPYPILDLVPYLLGLMNILIMSWIIFTFIKTRSGLKKLSAECGVNVSPAVLGNSINNHRIDQEIEASKRVKIRRLWWYYDFDELIEWLEQKVSEGLKLRYIKRGFTFMFEKTMPSKVKYYVDTRRNVRQDYYDLHILAGYNLVYDSTIQFGRIIIWSRKYSEGESTPEGHNDNTERHDGAKRLLKNNLKWILYWLVVGATQLFIAFNSIFILKINQLKWVLPLSIWTVLIAINLYALYKSIRGYRKTKRKAEEN